MRVPEAGPGVEGRVDREDQVQEQQRQYEKVKRRIQTLVIFARLWFGHSSDDTAMLR